MSIQILHPVGCSGCPRGRRYSRDNHLLYFFLCPQYIPIIPHFLGDIKCKQNNTNGQSFGKLYIWNIIEAHTFNWCEIVQFVYLLPISVPFQAPHIAQRAEERVRATFGITITLNNLNHGLCQSQSLSWCLSWTRRNCFFQPLQSVVHESQNDYNNLITSIWLQNDGHPSRG